MLCSLINKLWKPVVYTAIGLKLLFSDPCYAQIANVSGTVKNQLNSLMNNIDVRFEQVEDRSKFYSGTTNNGQFVVNNVVVPVELMSFTGKYNLGNNLLELNWSTASETNNFGFEIEQLINNEWKKIGWVNGYGNSSSQKDYSFSINNISLEAGNHSLRLKQEDFDGKAEYGPVLNINIPKPDKAEIGAGYPSSGSIINFPIKLNETGEIDFTVYTISGKEVRHIKEKFNAGYYTLKWDGRNNLGIKVARENYIANIRGNGLNKSRVFSFDPNGAVPLNEIMGNTFKDETIIKSESLKKSAGVIYDIIFSGNNILSDTLKKVNISSDTTINKVVTQIIKINTNVKDNYSNNNLIKNNLANAKLVCGDSVYTDANGNAKLTIPINANRSYEIKIKKNNYFVRTFTVNSSEDSVNINEEAAVPYPTSVSADTFKAFCEEANFSYYPLGLKTMFGNANAKYWISSHHYNDGSKATPQEQAYVKNLIVNEIYPNLKIENRLPIYIENPDSVETLPIHQNGVSLVMPIKVGFYIGTGDDNQDGVIDWNSIYLAQGQWNETYKKEILQELLSALIAPNEVTDKFNNKTVLVGGGLQPRPTDYLTEMDKMLIKICETYKPKEQIDNILGK